MRRVSFFFGVVALAGLWFGPLPDLAKQSFAAHMSLHMGVVAIVAPLLAFGVAGGSLDPVRRMPTWFPPIPLSLVELVVVWVWHAPALHHAARDRFGGFVAEQSSFLFAGVVVWLSAVGGDPMRRVERAGAGVAALLLTSMHMTLLGALLALTPRALYVHAEHASGSMLTPLEDQHLGGAIMLGIGGIAYLAGGLGLMTLLVRRKTSQEVRA